MRFDVQKSKASKSVRTREILSKISKKEHKVYQANFITGEFSVVGETQQQFNQARVMQEQVSMQTGTGSFVSREEMNKIPRDFNFPSHRLNDPEKYKHLEFDWFKFTMQMIILFFAIFYLQSAFARNPQGEYSSLLENNKSRVDFKNDKQLLKYIKTQDKKIEKQQKKG